MSTKKTPEPKRTNHSGAKPKEALRVERARADRQDSTITECNALLAAMSAKLVSIGNIEASLIQIGTDLRAMRADFDALRHATTTKQVGEVATA